MFHSHTEITIRRPNGNIEVVINKDRIWNDKLIAQARKATLAAGRGEIIGYKNVNKETKIRELTDEEKAMAEYDRAYRSTVNAMRGGEAHS
jgi:hypothetical protein